MVLRWVPALALAGVWWWAVLRLVLEPEHAGLVEGVVAAGGWGLSLLPVHATPFSRPEAAGPGPGPGPGGVARRKRRIPVGAVRRLISGASPRRRSGGGSGRS